MRMVAGTTGVWWPLSVCLPELLAMESWSGCCLMVLGCGCLWWQVLAPSLEQETQHQHTSTWKSGFYSLQSFIISHMPFLICCSTIGYLFMSRWIHLTSTHFASNNAPCRPNQGLVCVQYESIIAWHLTTILYIPLRPREGVLGLATWNTCPMSDHGHSWWTYPGCHHLQQSLPDIDAAPSKWGAECQREQVIMMGLTTLSPFTATEETGGRSVCSGGSHRERWLWATR